MRVCPRCEVIHSQRVQHCSFDGEALVDVATDPTIGKIVDRYRVLDRLGMGATANVYRVRHTVLDREYALKLLFADIATDHQLVERFRREARAVSKIEH